MAEKTLLYIVQDFPPLGGGGVMRAVKFCKYLPDFGWRPVVLTLKEQYNLPHLVDRSLLDELPADLEIHRTDSLKPSGAQRATLVTGSAAGKAGARARVMRSLRSAKRAVGQRYGVYQDEGYLWLPYACREIDAILASQRIDAVLTSSPPHGVHWPGAYASRRGRIPWLADFRDGWTGESLFQSQSKLRNRFERWQEERIVDMADRVTVAADQFGQWLADAHGQEYTAKGSLVTNGYDAADFAELEAQGLPTPGSAFVLTLAHVGGAGGTRRPIRPLLAALQSLQACGVRAGDVTLQLVGALAREDADVARTTSEVSIEPHLPHAQALQRMGNADVLVLIQNRHEADSHTGKLFEYVAARRPILTLTWPGQLADLVQREGWGWVAHPEDVAGIQNALLRIYALWKEGRLADFQPPAESRARFERRALTGRLATILDEMVSARSGSGQSHP